MRETEEWKDGVEAEDKEAGSGEERCNGQRERKRDGDLYKTHDF